jgi:hypothetical protein
VPDAHPQPHGQEGSVQPKQTHVRQPDRGRWQVPILSVKNLAHVPITSNSTARFPHDQSSF